jgi:hypothetical protein
MPTKVQRKGQPAPSIKHVATLDAKRLKESLPYYGKDALPILRESMLRIHVLSTDGIKRIRLIARRVAALERGQL